MIKTGLYLIGVEAPEKDVKGDAYGHRTASRALLDLDCAAALRHTRSETGRWRRWIDLCRACAKDNPTRRR